MLQEHGADDITITFGESILRDNSIVPDGPVLTDSEIMQIADFIETAPIRTEAVKELAPTRWGTFHDWCDWYLPQWHSVLAAAYIPYTCYKGDLTTGSHSLLDQFSSPPRNSSQRTASRNQ